MSFIEKRVLIASEGHFCYQHEYKDELVCDKIVASELEKSLKYVDSIAITEGLAHQDPNSLRMVIGKINNLHMTEVDGKMWLAGTGHFDTDKITGQFLKHLKLNIPISGSISNWVEVFNGVQTEMFPTHFLMHPELNPNIPGAGTITAANSKAAILFRIRNNQTRRKNVSEQDKDQLIADLRKTIEELKAKIAALESENDGLSKTKEENVKILAQNKELLLKVNNIEESQKLQIQNKLADANYTDAELKEMTFREMQVALNAIERSNDQVRENLKKTEEMQKVEIRQQLIDHGLTVGEMKPWTLQEMKNALNVIKKVAAPPGNPPVSMGNVGSTNSGDRSQDPWAYYNQKKKENAFNVGE